MKDVDPRIAEAIAKFPATFGLRAHEGTFRISPESSYIGPGPFAPAAEQYVVLYTQKLWLADNAARVKPGWCDFAKGSPAELERQVVKVGMKFACVTSWTDDEGSTFKRRHEREAVDWNDAYEQERLHNEERYGVMYEEGWRYAIESVSVLD